MRCEKIGGVEAARRRVEIKCEKIRGIARTKGNSGSNWVKNELQEKRNCDGEKRNCDG